MPDVFNPYLQWLGISFAGPRPTHYELLGLEPYESDPQRIATASANQMVKVRGIRPGANLEAWQRVLEELQAAQRCLSDQTQKGQYDVTLREQKVSRSAASPAKIKTGPTEPSAAQRSTDPKPTADSLAPGRNVLPPGRNVLPPGRTAASPQGGASPAPQVGSGSPLSGGAASPPSVAANSPPAGKNVLPPGRNVLPPPRAPTAQAAPKETERAAQTPPSGNPPTHSSEIQPAAPSGNPNAALMPPGFPSPASRPGGAPAGQAAPPGPRPPLPGPPVGYPQPPSPQPPRPGYPPQVGYPSQGSVPGAGRFPAPPGFPPGAGSPGVSGPPMPTGAGYAQGPSYPPSQGFPPPQAYPNPQGYAPAPGIRPPQGYPPAPGYPPALGYSPAQGYPPPQGFPGPGGFPPAPAYPGMPPAPGMQTGPAMPPGVAAPPGIMPPAQSYGGAPSYPPTFAPFGAGASSNFAPGGMPGVGAPSPPGSGEEGAQFFDSLLDDRASPLDELGLGGPSPTAQATSWPDAQPASWPDSAPASSPPPHMPLPGTQGFMPFAPGPASQFTAHPAAAEFASAHGAETAVGSPPGVDMTHLDELAGPTAGPSVGRTYPVREKDPNFGIKIFAGFGVGLMVLLGGLMAYKIFSHGNSDTVADSTDSGGPNTVSPNNTKPPPEHPGNVPGRNDHPPDKTPHDGPTPEQPAPGSNEKTPPIAPPANVTPTPVEPPPAPKIDPPVQPPPPKADPPKSDLPKPIQTKPPPAKPKPKPVDSAQAATFRKLLISARTKLAERSLPEAKQLIDQATKQAATPLQKDRAEKIGMLVKYVGEFWGAVHDAVKGLNPTDEIDVGSTKVIVVSKEAEAITLHVAQQNKHFTIRQLPSGLAVALAERWLDPKKAENKVFLGAFYAVDPKSDPQDARRLWKEAADGGVDVKDLLPLLDPEPSEAELAQGSAEMATEGPPDSMSADTMAAPNNSPNNGPAPNNVPAATSFIGNPALPPVPPQTLLERAERKVKNQFDEGYLTATNDPDRVALAKKLLEGVDQVEDMARKYVMCREARDLAALGGAPTVMVDAVDHLGHLFRVDPLLMKVDALANYPPTGQIAGRETVGVALTLIDEAVDAKRFDLANRLGEIAVAAAKTSQSPDLMQKALARSKQIEEQSKGRMAGNPQ